MGAEKAIRKPLAAPPARARRHAPRRRRAAPFARDRTTPSKWAPGRCSARSSTNAMARACWPRPNSAAAWVRRSADSGLRRRLVTDRGCVIRGCRRKGLRRQQHQNPGALLSRRARFSALQVTKGSRGRRSRSSKVTDPEAGDQIVLRDRALETTKSPDFIAQRAAARSGAPAGGRPLAAGGRGATRCVTRRPSVASPRCGAYPKSACWPSSRAPKVRKAGVSRCCAA